MSLPPGAADVVSVTAQTLTHSTVVDLHDRQVLLRSWLHVVHGPGLDARVRLDAEPPALRSLVGNAVAWHIAYAIVALAGCLVVARSGSGSGIAEVLTDGGRVGLAIGTVVLWWGGSLLATALWWTSVRLARR